MPREFKYNDGLVCPSCAGENLHQVEVSVFWRDSEDSHNGTYVSTSTNRIDKDIDPNRNPSSRRDGLLVKFRCECCTADPELAIYQHKGTTFIEWHTMRMMVNNV